MAAFQDTAHPIQVLADETHYRLWLAVTLQITGALTAKVSYYLYGSLPKHGVWVGGLTTAALLLGALLAAGAFYGRYKGFPAWIRYLFRINNAVDLDEVVSYIASWLLMSDAAICGILVLFSGGLCASFFSPLLLAIIGITCVFRLPRTLLAETLLAVAIIVTATQLYYSYDTTLAWDVIHGGNYRSSLITNILATTILTVFAGTQSLFHSIPYYLVDRICNQLTLYIPSPAIHRDAIKAGMKSFTWDVNVRLPASNLSSVHNLATIVEQAILLNIPFSAYGLDRTRWGIVHLTFLAHWVDDFFDALYRDIVMIPHTRLSVDDVFRNSRHLMRIHRHLNRRFQTRLRRRWRSAISVRIPPDLDTLVPGYSQLDTVIHICERRFGTLRAKGNVDLRRIALRRGLTRIMLASVMQHCSTLAGVGPIIALYVKEVTASPQLHQRLIALYQGLQDYIDDWIIIWGTAKSVMEIFDCLGEDFTSTESELYTILYTPIMIYHNLRVELERERLSDAFRVAVLRISGNSKNVGLNEADPLVHFAQKLEKCLEIFEANADLLSENTDVRKGRYIQARATLEAYGYLLPPALQGRYVRTIKTVWPTEETEMSKRAAEFKSIAVGEPVS